MLISLFKKSLAVLLLAATTGLATAGQVLVNPVTNPTTDRFMTGTSEEPPSGAGLTPLRGYRTASDGAFAYQSGWLGEGSGLDGWVSKTSAAGVTQWSKTMRSIVDASPYAATITANVVTNGADMRFLVNDIIYADGSLYVCGTTRVNQSPYEGYLARMSPAGVLEDFSVFSPNGFNQTARAVALCSMIRPDGVRVGVVGDWNGTSLYVKHLMSSTPTTVIQNMIGRNESGSVRDLFAVSFGKNLNDVRRGWTLGLPNGNEYATAVAFSGEADLIVAATYQVPQGSLGGFGNFTPTPVSNIVAGRNMHFSGSSSNVVNSTIPGSIQNFPGVGGKQSMIVRLNGTDASVAAVASPNGNINFPPDSHITDMLVDNGQLFVTGHWKGSISPAINSVWSSQNSSYDVFVSRLDVNNLSSQKTIFLGSSGDDESTQLAASGESVYVAGSAASTLTHREPGTASEVITTTTALTGSAPRHLFWTKLKKSDLTKEWHITPYEDQNRGIGISPGRFYAGVTAVADNLLLMADNPYYITTPEITHSFGNASNFTTTAHSSLTYTNSTKGGGAFNVAVKFDGTYLEEVNLNILSAYGNPVPHKGLQKLAAGQTVKFSVEPTVYENAAGTILDPTNAALIKTDAVTRRICTGYTVRNSTVNGTANTLEYTVNVDTEITFLWRTEHALEVKTNMPAGLTSEAAGAPSPEVNKHWIAQGSPVIAQIDGAYSSITEAGVRYRSTGYTAAGAAVPAGGTSGNLVAWPSYQNRQQVPQFTLNTPATITWQWQKELSFRVGTNPASAGGGATATAGGITVTGDGEFWFPPGSSVTATSPALRDGGQQTLLRYSNAIGSVIPASETAVNGVLTKTFTISTASTILWEYGKTPARQRVTVGDFAVWTGMPSSVVNTQPVGVTVVSGAPPGTNETNGIAWEPAGRRLLPLRPGKYLLEFNDPAVDASGAMVEDNVTMEITAGFQGDPVPNVVPAATFAPVSDSATYQTFIAGSPAVVLNTSATDGVHWQANYSLTSVTVDGLALAGGNAAVTNTGGFVATEPGTSVLVFSKAAAGLVGRGNLESESLFLRVVRCRLWNDPVVLTTGAATVGTAIAPPATHDLGVIGHNGHVVPARARYNVSVHDNVTLQGPIFPVNTWHGTDAADKLVVTWFNRDATVATNWPSSSIDYTVSWPTVTPRIVIAGRLGSEGKAGTAAGGAIQTLFTPPQYTNLAVYVQPDKSLPGYNPNEEHAFTAPSFLDASRTAVFALQNSLNVTTADASFTSPPAVLVQYSETLNSVTTPRMAVYAIEWEDATVTDTRLPAYNQAYTPKYQIEAGKILTPPWPLPILYGVTGWPAENVITNTPSTERAAWQDRKKQWWAASGDTDVATEVNGVFHYPLRDGFYHATKVAGDRIALQAAVDFNTVWPAGIPILKNGETITHSGGEAFRDGLTPNGLPSVVGMASAEIIYDHANKELAAGQLATNWVARVANPIATIEVDLPLADMPETLRPASGNILVDGLTWRFKGAHAGIQQRLVYDSQRGKLGFRGFLNGRTTGNPELTAAPPAINLLQPNIMTASEKTTILALDADTKWTTAVDALFKKTRDPVGNTDTAFTVGLGGTAATPTLPTQLGSGLAIIANPDLADPAKMTAITSDGYVTFAENNAATLGDAPIALHIFKLDRSLKYRGAVAPIYPENVFDEKITLRHNGDFGGNVNDLVFQWYYREEDGTAANPPGVAFPSPPGVPVAGKWTLFGEIAGGNEISLAGASAALLADNLFFARWRHKNEAAADASYSQYAGAANSRPPVVGSPSIATDAAYVPQLAEGWVKRVTNAVNAFDARIRDFRNNSAPSTAVSMLQQAGGRWEGNVAFNPAKDVIENYGLIELYQTVLNRAADLSINLQPGTSGVNTALLNAANRIASLYTLLGNEAATDAINPTIGFGTTSGQYGNLAPTIFCFQNQTANLLEEELALLRGRGEIGARPAYNRLMWNFTNGQGEAAYVTNYGITDMTNDGFLDANDAARLYPQGHGDAWGHYTMALRGYAGLFRQANYAWDTRSELYQINGVVFNIDYMDERAYAETAAARAKAGAAIVDLVYRQKYTENPAGQWQGYQDTNTDRAWGVYESAQRAATGGFFDWVTANALLPSSDDAKEGITRVDRTTVGALKEIASNAAEAQSKLDMADNGLNPLGLDSETVPFDIDPARVDRGSVAPATHFEQVYERAVAAAQNALTAFNHANSIDNMLRRTASSAEQLRQQTIDQDRDYRNRLIELLGTPYQGQIGAGKAYPAGYTGPDLFLFMYADQVAVDANTVPKTDVMKDMKVRLGGLIKLSSDTNPFKEGDQAAPDYAKSLLTNWFLNDYPTSVLDIGQSPYWEFTVPVRTNGYAFKAPAEWGVRASPGKVQAAIADLLMAEYDLLLATEGYEGFVDDFTRKMKVITAKTGLAAEDISVVNNKLGWVRGLNVLKATADQTALIMDKIVEGKKEIAEATAATVPDDWTQFGDFIKGAVEFVQAGSGIVLRKVQAISESSSIWLDAVASNAEHELTIAQTEIAHKTEVIDMLEDLEAHTNTEPDWRLGIFQASERLRSAGDRYRAVLQEALRLIDEREAFNKRVAATTTQQRYEDYTFRISRNDALTKYRSSLELASRYAWLASRAYAFELNLPDNHSANATPISSAILRSRTLGRFENGQPVAGNGGIAEHLAVLKTNFDSFKGQLGFNSPATQTVNFSVRSELARIGLSSRVNADWRTQLETYRVADLWNYSYSKDGTDYGQIFRRYCRPFAPESAGPQPALVIPFGSTITAGQNWFGKTLMGGDSAFTASNFSTKIRLSGVKFESYNATALSVTPQVYLVPVGLDRMYYPESNLLEARSWKVLDQRIPAPMAITPNQLADSSWLPFTGAASGYFEEARRFPAFRAYHDSGGFSNAEMLSSSRLVGRSAWNTQWVLIIPSNALLSDPADGAYPGDVDAGLDTLIYGAPLPNFTHATAGTTNRDGNGVRDIRLLFQTYSASGN